MSQPRTPSISSLTRNPLAVRCRPDLKAVQTKHKHESAVVVKDPIAMKYHRMRPDEYFVLQSLNGELSLEQICDEYQRTFPPQKVTAAELNQLLFRFHESGLTISDSSMQGDRLTDRRRKDRKQRWMQHISGVLFIRFPGVDPEPFLKRLYPLARPFLSWLGMAVAAMLCLFAAVVFATRWDSFTAEFPQMHDWIRLDSMLILAAVIGGTKVLHEIGHALTCKHFGGECHQIGPMLLVFTPALYCDTSDSWMLPSRWQRAAVGMAGIGTEVLLAAIATCVWASTAPGITHYIAMNVMLVCSVSTLLFNANPLLRYDGYYVLSDLCDVPNLGERSRKLLAGHTNQLLFGIDELPPEPMTAWARFWMLTYALMAAIYRWGLTLLILYVVSLILRPYGLESIGRVLCLFAAGGLVFTLFRGPVKFFRNPARRKQIQMNRTFASLLVIACLIAAAFYPLPAGVSGSARIVPRAETPIYITTSGQLQQLKRLPGDTVKKGDEIATLINRDIEIQYLTIKGRLDTQKQIVDAIRASAIETPDAANDLPGQEALLEDLKKQLATRESRRNGLTLKAPADGTLIASPHRAAEQEELGRLVSWHGFPTEKRNSGCLLEPGHELMSVATDPGWDAEMILDQSEIQRLEIGSVAKFALESMPETKFKGVVIDIARAKWTAQEHAERRDDISATRREKPPATSYVVRLELEDVDMPMIAGATAVSRIEAKEMSVVSRATRFLNSLLRFR
ncbi:MAG: peptidase M50 [Rubripirellula sp.]